MKKEIVFYCDNCGSEVPDGVKSCHVCARVFTSIRCPACNFSGEEGLFTEGCPSCGYSAAEPKKKSPRKAKAKRKPKKSLSSAAPAPLKPLVRSVCIAAVSLFFMIAAILITR